VRFVTRLSVPRLGDRAAPDAVVVGAGHNGLVAANVLADAGWSVVVHEAEPEVGGAVRSGELLEPGFVNDRCSAFYPLGAASPVFRMLELERFGLRYRHGPLVPRAPGRRRVVCRPVAGSRRDGGRARRRR
jgi:phytoene dehydrogenase-like protein